MIYSLFVLPTPETAQFFREVFQGSPTFIDPDTFGVYLGSSRTPISARQGHVLRAMPDTMDQWYETAMGHSNWLLPIIPSPEMVARHDTIGDAWGRQFVPFIKVSDQANDARHTRNFMRSISTSLVDIKPILTFDNEVVVETDSVLPFQQDFYEDYIARGRRSDVVFVDADQNTDDL